VAEHDEGPELTPVKRALLEVRTLRARVRALEEERSAPIAVVGMAARFPGADGADAFWQLLEEGRDAITPIPSDRWDVERYFDADPSAPGKMSTRWGGFIREPYAFDAGFFGVSPREAMSMDPQQRLVLEVAWEALEHAGVPPDRLSGSRVGVFMGVAGIDWAHRLIGSAGEEIDAYLAQGIAHGAVSGRLAYSLGLAGPALSVDTACSSSLYAAHLAMQSLRRGESELALVGGVNLILIPELLVTFSKAGMMAADGRCKSFDARADGYVRSEGCGVVVLKPLARALDDGDHIWAVLRGSAANQDGRSSGMTAPSRPAQAALLRDALADAGLEPRQVSYVETHGTGTSLGDPIEVGALSDVFATPRERDLLIGTAKSNVGHLEAAAGVVGLMKAVLCVHHARIPPSLHFREPNPYIPWGEIPIWVAADATPFPEVEGRRIAGVSSFGFTGTNVHLIVEAPPRPAGVAPPAAGPRLLKLSTREASALDRLARHTAQTVEGLDSPHFAAFADWMGRGRADLTERLALVANSGATAADMLRRHLAGEEVEGLFRANCEPGSPRIAMLFTGHGSQRARMAMALAERHAVVREALEACDTLARPLLERSLLDVLRAEPGSDEAALLTRGMTYSQPALFSVEYALSRLWSSWGVEPSLVLGHSVGEYVAATVAEVMSLEDGLRLVCARGRLFDRLPKGAMLAAFASEEVVARALATHGREVSVAAVNGPTEIVISGTVDGVSAVGRALAAAGVETRELAVAQAAHSPMLDPILDEFEAVARIVRFSPPQLGYISCTTGDLVASDEVTSAAYWRRHLREPVRFHAALRTALDEGYRVFIEAGPHPVLGGLGRRAFPESGAAWIPSLREGRPDEEQILEGLGAFYTAGGVPDWAGVAPGPRLRPEEAPTYPWEHRTYRLDAAPAMAPSASSLWEQAVAAGRREEERGPLDFHAEVFPARWEALDRLAEQIMMGALARLAGDAWGRPLAEEALADMLGVVPSYRKLLVRWVERLVRSGELTRRDGTLAPASVESSDRESAAWEVADQVMGDDGAFLVTYLRRCARVLPAVLRGEADPLETLFPGGSTETANALYRDWALVRYYSHIMRALFDAVLAARGSIGPARVLEVGAGTGGTTAVLAPVAGDRVVEYLFTDVSGAFLAGAEEHFDGPFMRFKVLDLERPAVEQGFQPGRYDVVVAANVLHAVKNLPDTLRDVRALLAPGGVLIALEITTYHGWFDVSTSLLEGWEHYEDEARRAHPVLGVTEWDALLAAQGFERVDAFPTSGATQRDFGFHVLLAQVPGAPSAVDLSHDAMPAGEAVRADVSEQQAAFRERLAAADPRARRDLLVELVREQIRRMLRLEESDEVGRSRRLMELGLDSLMAVELRSRLDAWLALPEPLPSTLVFDYPTIDAIVGLLETRLGGELADEDHGRGVKRGQGARSAGAPAGGSRTEVSEISDAEAEERLLRHLETLERGG